MNNIEKIYQQFQKNFSVSTDSRKINKDDVFFALKGENFDGNSFALQVAEEGVAACVVADRPDLPCHERIIKVENALVALQQLATYHRDRMSAKVLSITGTNGKTTTKELISAALSQKFNIIHTLGNYNNHIGVPLTLLQIKPETEIAIVEMGANHPKEIETLAHIAKPDFGIITNVGKAHLEGFGSIEGVINTKNELYCFIRETCGMVFTNIQNDILMELSIDLNRITYGENENASVWVKRIDADPYLSISWKGDIIRTNLVGDYNFENVAAAIAVGTYFGVDKKAITKALETYEPTNSRSQVIQTQKNRIIMDAYNANPVSMQAAIRNFKNICGSKSLLILGDMRELGADSHVEHLEVLKLLEALNYENVFLVGPCFHEANQNKEWKTFINVDELHYQIQKEKLTGYSILIKGSRGIKLEKIIPLIP
jgi:UDP-N-acetylmuramoyl-tripeptide--D-alanyl-D-alanine ligase